MFDPADNSAICPHCGKAQFLDLEDSALGQSRGKNWELLFGFCGACKLPVVFLSDGAHIDLIYPKTGSYRLCPTQVPEQLASDFKEACTVLPASAKASAALSRRCLQHLLREQAGVKSGNLADEIDQAVQRGVLPSHIANALDSVRIVGNFAAHPTKSQKTGEIIEVEVGEAEWNLDVLESLFDFFYVQPEELRKRKDALNRKLADAKKPPLK